jgi:AcrR family transcriptional regulator
MYFLVCLHHLLISFTRMVEGGEIKTSSSLSREYTDLSILSSKYWTGLSVFLHAKVDIGWGSVKLMETAGHESFENLQAFPRKELAPRDRVLSTALDLFPRCGVHTVGIDRIIAESGVAKMTFYKHFPSKSKLVAEYIRYKNAEWFILLERFTAASRTPANRILGIFDALEFAFKTPGFQGCPFIKGMAEFGPEIDADEVKLNLATHFAQTREFVERLAAPLKVKDRKGLVDRLLSLIEGSFVIAEATGRSEVAAINKEAARILIKHG